jgi:DNA-binding LacI/PurR family transcriptional regulator
MYSKKASIRDVAKAAGLSLATVSNVFSGKKRVKESSERRVREAAECLGYHVDRAASQLRSGTNKTIAVLVPNIADTFFSTFVSEIERLAIQKGYDVLIAITHGLAEVEVSRIATLMSWRPAGCILVPTTGGLPDSFRSSIGNLPIVLVDRTDPEKNEFDTVTINNKKIGYSTGVYLRAKGHQHILVAVSDLSYPPIAARLEGFLEAFSSPEDKFEIVELCDEHLNGCHKIVKRLGDNPSITAVFSLNYMTTLDSLSAFSEMELVVGQDISFVAFDDDLWMSARLTGLTAIRQPVKDMASTAWTRLLERIENAETDLPVQSKVLTAELIERKSVININNR